MLFFILKFVVYLHVVITVPDNLQLCQSRASLVSILDCIHAVVVYVMLLFFAPMICCKLTV